MTRSQGVSIAELRQALQSRLQNTSLRQLAEEVGMSWSGLRTFLRGTEPYSVTTHKLTVWYTRYLGGHQQETDADAARAALTVLLRHVTPSRRHEVQQQILKVIADEARKPRSRSPVWLAKLRGE